MRIPPAVASDGSPEASEAFEAAADSDGTDGLADGVISLLMRLAPEYPARLARTSRFAPTMSIAWASLKPWNSNCLGSLSTLET